MRLCVGVVEREFRRGEALELRANLRGELRANPRAEEEAHAGAHEVVRKRAVALEQIGDAFRRKHRAAVDEYDVQADREARQTVRAPDGIGGGRRTNHEARGAEGAIAVCPLDSLIDFGRRAKIVGSEDQPFHRAGRGINAPTRAAYRLRACRRTTAAGPKRDARSARDI